MTVVLGVDTAGPVVSAALWWGDAPGPAWSARIVRGADGVLMPAIVSLLSQAAARGTPPERVAVAVGPGSFTGLRVGVATALGLAMSRDLPVVPVSSLQARAAAVPNERRVLALLDARKGRVYAGLFDSMGALPRPLGDELDVAPEVPLAWDVGIAIGEGARVHAEALAAAGWRLAAASDAGAAPEVARLGASLVPVDAALVQLQYIRPPDAQRPSWLAGSAGLG
jgi:tRNA threonylcarbamoyladenosine biosynthesis protein TsaB